MGNTLGPLFGAAMFELGGIQTPFWVLSSLFIILGPIVRVTLPPEADKVEETNSDSSHDRVTYVAILTCPKTLALFLYNVLNMNWVILMPTFAYKLDSLGLT